MNELLNPSRGLRLAVGDETWTVSFHSDAANLAAPACGAELEWKSTRAAVTIDGFRFSAPLQATLGDCPLPEQLPDSLVAAVLSRILDGASPDEELRLRSVACGATAPAPGDTAYPVVISFSIQGSNGGTARGALQCESDFAALLAAQLETIDQIADATPNAVPLTGSLQLRSIQLDSEVFAGLEPADILICGRYGQGGLPVLRVYFGPGVYYFARLDGETLSMQAKEPEASAAEEPEKNKPASVDFNKIPVRVSFELGQITLTMAELNSIAAGSTLELPAPVDSPVIIKANGAAVGTGALIRIEDHLGVRILEWSKNS